MAIPNHLRVAGFSTKTGGRREEYFSVFALPLFKEVKNVVSIELVVFGWYGFG